MKTMTMKVVTAVLAVLVTAACSGFDRLLSVQTPSRLAEDAYLVPANAALISSSAVADYECALGSYAVASGMAAGELFDATQTAARWSYDRRNILAVDATYSTSNCENIGVFTPINTARYTNDQAVTKLEEWSDAQVPNRQRLIAVNSAMAGFSLILLGEGFCSGTINVGPSLTPAQLFDSAEVRFTKAIAAATAANDAAILNLAYAGRARARINKANRTGAAEDAARVPVAFVYNATSDATVGRRNNRVFQQNNQSFSVTVATAYRTLNDPRVSLTNQNRLASDQVNQLWTQNKFASLTASYPIASGIESQLILAEARGGAEGIAILNALRARTGVALPALTAQETANFNDAVAEERRRELFLQGNRWFDVRRFNPALVPTTGTAYAKGGVYGDQRCWPLPDAELLANPNTRG
ncbi:MAG TPA: RagB/SusD family nutrient uptake outer membrane protein [Gemmatimonas sp.]|uniref:RagB/SusD family nutrient uptake outer membrane protein n=1 Tax=Gemmatimonas sp. TaxID=1962908 RepID=UPI002ED9EDD8